MESLVILVVIILLVTLFSGPIALLFTWLPAFNRETTSAGIQILRRTLVTVFSLVGSFTSFNLFIASGTLPAMLMAVFGSITAFFAVKREYFPDGLGLGKRNGNGLGLGKRNGNGLGLGKRNGNGLGLGKRNGNGFGRRGDRRNGPDGQH